MPSILVAVQCSQNGLLPRTFGHSVSPSFSILLGGSTLTGGLFNPVWKRRKDLLYIGSVHGGELPEMYGITGDHLGTDAISMHTLSYRFQSLTRTISVNFINHQDPNYPEGSTAPSLLSNITWPQYTLDSKQMLLFSDDVTEEYTSIPDTYRADAIATIIKVQTELGL